jgi:hypothetical protein
MNQIRSWAIVTLLMLATTIARSVSIVPAIVAQDDKGQRVAQNDLPPVEQQLKVLTAKLELTGDQQDKIKPILQDLHDATLKLMQDASLSQEERLARITPVRYQARDRMREILNDDQKKKLDDYLQGPHSEMHGPLTGNPAGSPQN